MYFGVKELVGVCHTCRKDVFCLDGFLNGVYSDNKEIYCFACYEKLDLKKENPQ